MEIWGQILLDVDNVKYYIHNRVKEAKREKDKSHNAWLLNESIVTPMWSSTDPAVSSNNSFLQEFLCAAVFCWSRHCQRFFSETLSVRYGVSNRLEMHNFKPQLFTKLLYNITTKFREMWLNVILFESRQENNSLYMSQQLIL